MATITVTAMVSAGFPSPSLDIETYANSQLISSAHWDEVAKGQSVQDSVEFAEVGTWDVFARARLSNPFGEIEAESPHKTIEIHPTLGPSAWWKCDEGSGNELIDSSGNSNTIALTNALWTPSSRGTKPTWNGITTTARKTNSMGCDAYTGNAITVMAWIYPRSAGGNDQGYVATNFMGSGDVANSGWLLYVSGTPPWSAHIYSSVFTDGNYAHRETLPFVHYNEWCHVAMAFENSGDKLVLNYYNGEEVGVVTQQAATGTILNDLTNTVSIGNTTETDIRSFDGYIDDMRIYQRKLTAEEIATIYNTTK